MRRPHFRRVFGRLPGKILATGADYLGFQFAGPDYLASTIRRGRLPGPAKRWGRIPGPNFRQKAGQITWAGRLPGPRPKAGQTTCLHVFRSVATQAPNRTKPVLGVFLRAAWPGMTNGRGLTLATVCVCVRVCVCVCMLLASWVSSLCQGEAGGFWPH